MAGAVKNLYTQFSFCFFNRIGNRIKSDFAALEMEWQRAISMMYLRF